jgi:hypothetical protein
MQTIKRRLLIPFRIAAFDGTDQFASSARRQSQRRSEIVAVIVFDTKISMAEWQYKDGSSNAANSKDTVLTSVLIANDSVGQTTSIVRSFAVPNLGPLFHAIADSYASADGASMSEYLGSLSVVFRVDDLDFLPSFIDCHIPAIIAEFLEPGHSPQDRNAAITIFARAAHFRTSVYFESLVAVDAVSALLPRRTFMLKLFACRLSRL